MIRTHFFTLELPHSAEEFELGLAPFNQILRTLESIDTRLCDTLGIELDFSHDLIDISPESFLYRFKDRITIPDQNYLGPPPNWEKLGSWLYVSRTELISSSEKEQNVDQVYENLLKINSEYRLNRSLYYKPLTVPAVDDMLKELRLGMKMSGIDHTNGFRLEPAKAG